MRPEPFVPSVPWRMPTLFELMYCLTRQTLFAPVTFVLDGHSLDQADEVALHANDLALYHRILPGRGAGSRWRWIARYGTDDTLALSLDDDMLPGPMYVQNTVAAWERIGAPFSWCGDLLEGRAYVRVTAALVEDARLFNTGAGALCVPAKMLRGIEEDPAADRFLGPLGHDEALVSWWLTAKHGAKLWRPRGEADVREHPLGHDARSQWNSHGARCAPLIAELEARGWPAIDKPVRHPLGRFHGVHPHADGTRRARP